jgi:hypothetical protein
MKYEVEDVILCLWFAVALLFFAAVDADAALHAKALLSFTEASSDEIQD